MRIALIDDHAIVREGLRAMLAGEGFEVVGEASDGREALTAIDLDNVDLFVLDVALEGSSGLVLARELMHRAPRARILMLSVHGGEHFIARALAAGALGYALKSQPANEIVTAIRTVGRGERYLPPRVPREAIESLLLEARSRRAAGHQALDPLSVREREIFELLVAGQDNARIARQLCISISTVATHRARILRKLRLHSLAELVRFAADHRLLVA